LFSQEFEPMNELLVDQVFEIVKDYHADTGFEMTKNRIVEWVNQFDEHDRDFVLSEFLHLLNKGIYVSKDKGKEILWRNLEAIASKQKYLDLRTFLWETRFILTQKKSKSQDSLYRILQELCIEKIGCELNADMHIPVKNYIYLDDILATGKTAYQDLKEWIYQENQLDKIVSGQVSIFISLFACHLRGFQNNNWRLKLDFNKDDLLHKIKLQSGYLIDDRVRFPSSTLNFAIPCRGLNEKIDHYFDLLQSTSKENEAFRNQNKPIDEMFYSNPTNRARFEAILGSKGVEILEKVKELNPAHRPFGATFPSYKTLGTGTLFFTWRNISNTCPLVFWWDNPSHNWKSLFPLHNRG
jgi:hypothetical protein